MGNAASKGRSRDSSSTDQPETRDRPSHSTGERGESERRKCRAHVMPPIAELRSSTIPHCFVPPSPRAETPAVRQPASQGAHPLPERAASKARHRHSPPQPPPGRAGSPSAMPTLRVRRASEAPATAHTPSPADPQNLPRDPNTVVRTEPPSRTSPSAVPRLADRGAAGRQRARERRKIRQERASRAPLTQTPSCDLSLAQAIPRIGSLSLPSAESGASLLARADTTASKPQTSTPQPNPPRRGAPSWAVPRADS